jgi:dienelactone hydrolase
MRPTLRILVTLVLGGFSAWSGIAPLGAQSNDPAKPADAQQAERKWDGKLALPPGRGPFPVVIVAHGCDGVSSHSRGWARRVGHWGYATYLLDSYSLRGHTEICADTSVVPFWQRSWDIADAAAHLRTLPVIDGKRIAALGLSHGASGAVHAARMETFAPAGPPDLRAVVAFYPYCQEKAVPFATDVLILVGDADDWTPAQQCIDLVAQHETLPGPRPVLKVYPGATHAFDIRAGERLDHGHVERYDPAAARDALKLAREFLAMRMRK